VNCPQCGAVRPDDDVFCGRCGQRMSDVDVDALADGPESVGSDGSHRGRVWLVAACAVLAVGAVVAVGWLVLRSDRTAAGGADSPEEVATGFAAAMSSEDLLAAATYVSPLEAPGIEQLLITVRDTAKAQGIAGLSAGDGVDIDLQVSTDDVTELADGFARVELRMELSVTGSPDGPVGGLLGADGIEMDDHDLADALDSRDLTIVVVEESGRWYVSPMLTLGEYIADSADLPSPDYDVAVAAADEPTAADEEEAIQQVGDAIEERDATRAAGALAPGEARFVRVFGRAIDELLAEWEGDISFEDLQMSEVSDGRWAVEHLELSSQQDNGLSVSGVQVDDGCVMFVHEYDIDQWCLDDLDWLTEPLDSDQFVVHTSREGGAARVELVATVIDDLGQLAARVGREGLLDALDEEVLDEPIAVTVDEPVALAFTGQRYQVVEWVAAKGRTYLLGPADGDLGVELDVYASEDGQDWYWVDWTADSERVLRPLGDGGWFRVVVRPDLDCADDDTCVPGQGTATVLVRRLQTIPAAVGTVVRPNLGAGVSVLLQIPADADHRYEVTTDTDGVELRLVDYGTAYDFDLDADGYLPGPYSLQLEILVTNTGSTEVLGAIEMREHDLAGADLPDGEGIELDFSSGAVSYELDVAGADSVTITVVPDGAQDVMLAVKECVECWADAGYSGESESTTVAIDGESTLTVDITGYTDADAFGTVTLYVEYD